MKVFRGLVSLFRRSPPYCSEKDWIEDCFRMGGFVRKSHWGLSEIRRAEIVLSLSNRNLKVPSLVLSKNCFEKNGFGVLMHLLARRQELKKLHISVREATDLEAITNSFRHDQLETLEVEMDLEVNREKAILFRDLVRIPTKTLTLVFSPHLANDYAATLQAFRLGVEGRQADQLPRIVFRNVMIDNVSHESLPIFVSLACKTNILKGLEISPLPLAGGRHFSEFFRSIIPLVSLASSHLSQLKITQCIPLETNELEQSQVVDSLRQALAENKSLRLLSLSYTMHLESLWIQGIFPALTVNRTLRTLDFGRTHEPLVVVNFLQLLPEMKGLRHVTAPWHTGLGNLWIETLQRVDTLWRVDFPWNDFWGDCLPEAEKVQLRTIAALCRRNRSIHVARKFLQDVVVQGAPLRREQKLIAALEEMGEDKMGLSAVYTIYRASFDAFLYKAIGNFAVNTAHK